MFGYYYTVFPSWFTRMDLNRDGLIAPNEFDDDLNEQLLREISKDLSDEED